MKRRLCAAACACLLLAGCGGAKTQETEIATISETQSATQELTEVESLPTVVSTTETATIERAEIAEKVVYQDDSFKLTAKAMDYSGTNGVRIKFLAENNSDANVVFSASEFTVNGITVLGQMYIKTAAGKKTNDYAIVYKNSLENVGINDISEIIVQDAHIVDTDSFKTYATIPFTLDTSISQGFVQEIDKSGQTIIEKDGIVVKYKGVSQAWDNSEVLNFYVENLSDQNVNIMVKDVSVNGFTVYGSMVMRAYQHCVTYDTVTFSKEDFETNEIKSIEDVTIRLYACDSETFKTLWTSDEINLSRQPVETKGESEVDTDTFMPPDSVLLAIKAATGGVYNDFTIKNNDGNVLITCTAPGIGQAAPFLQSGNSELLASWKPFVESYQKACNVTKDYLENLGYDVPVKWILLNDEDKSKSLLEIIDGEVVYDVSKDGK